MTTKQRAPNFFPQHTRRSFKTLSAFNEILGAARKVITRLFVLSDKGLSSATVNKR